ncbi:MAG: hypothetical protein EBX40_00700, partial [Gammaproteobacteria bacterium]|nr:hypothetical protein [Gammaproteobacteria bacterium]
MGSNQSTRELGIFGEKAETGSRLKLMESRGRWSRHTYFLWELEDRQEGVLRGVPEVALAAQFGVLKPESLCGTAIYLLGKYNLEVLREHYFAQGLHTDLTQDKLEIVNEAQQEFSILQTLENHINSGNLKTFREDLKQLRDHLHEKEHDYQEKIRLLNHKIESLQESNELKDRAQVRLYQKALGLYQHRYQACKQRLKTCGAYLAEVAYVADHLSGPEQTAKFKAFVKPEGRLSLMTFLREQGIGITRGMQYENQFLVHHSGKFNRGRLNNHAEKVVHHLKSYEAPLFAQPTDAHHLKFHEVHKEAHLANENGPLRADIEEQKRRKVFDTRGHLKDASLEEFALVADFLRDRAFNLGKSPVFPIDRDCQSLSQKLQGIEQLRERANPAAEPFIPQRKREPALQPLSAAGLLVREMQADNQTKYTKASKWSWSLYRAHHAIPSRYHTEGKVAWVVRHGLSFLCAVPDFFYALWTGNSQLTPSLRAWEKVKSAFFVGNETGSIQTLSAREQRYAKVVDALRDHSIPPSIASRLGTLARVPFSSFGRAIREVGKGVWNLALEVGNQFRSNFRMYPLQKDQIDVLNQMRRALKKLEKVPEITVLQAVTKDNPLHGAASSLPLASNEPGSPNSIEGRPSPVKVTAPNSPTLKDRVRRASAFVVREEDVQLAEALRLPYHLDAYQGRNVLKGLSRGTQEFYDLFGLNLFAMHPMTGVVFTLTYGAALMPFLMPKVASHILPGFWNQWVLMLGKWSASGTASMAVASAFLNAKLAAMVLEQGLNGWNSWVIKGLRDFGDDPAFATIVLGASFALGHALVHGVDGVKIPALSNWAAEDIGTVPAIAETFVGLKGAAAIAGLLNVSGAKRAEAREVILEGLKREIREKPILGLPTLTDAELNQRLNAFVQNIENEASAKLISKTRQSNPSIRYGGAVQIRDFGSMKNLKSNPEKLEQVDEFMSFLWVHHDRLHQLSNAHRHQVYQLACEYWGENSRTTRSVYAQLYNARPVSYLEGSVRHLFRYLNATSALIVSILALPMRAMVSWCIREIHPTKKPDVFGPLRLISGRFKELFKESAAQVGSFLKGMSSIVVNIFLQRAPRTVGDITMNSVVARIANYFGLTGVSVRNLKASTRLDCFGEQASSAVNRAGLSQAQRSSQAPDLLVQLAKRFRDAFEIKMSQLDDLAKTEASSRDLTGQ